MPTPYEKGIHFAMLALSVAPPVAFCERVNGAEGLSCSECSCAHQFVQTSATSEFPAAAMLGGADASNIDSMERQVMSTATELRASAEAKFKKKELQRLDGCAAMVEYEAAGRATIEKTARLKALRLSQVERAPPVATVRASAKSKTKRPAKAGARRAVAV